MFEHHSAWPCGSDARVYMVQMRGLRPCVGSNLAEMKDFSELDQFLILFLGSEKFPQISKTDDELSH